jgi:hypothetical protein
MAALGKSVSDGVQGVDPTISSQERNIPKVHTEENSLVLIRFCASRDEGDREQVGEQKSNAGGGNRPNHGGEL